MTMTHTLRLDVPDEMDAADIDQWLGELARIGPLPGWTVKPDAGRRGHGVALIATADAGDLAHRAELEAARAEQIRAEREAEQRAAAGPVPQMIPAPHDQWGPPTVGDVDVQLRLPPRHPDAIPDWALGELPPGGPAALPSPRHRAR